MVQEPNDTFWDPRASRRNTRVDGGRIALILDPLLVVCPCRLVSNGLDVEADVDCSVFETNIRLLGGLLSAHMLATDPDLGIFSAAEGAVCDIDSAGGRSIDSGGLVYNGELLQLARRLGDRLLPAFQTETGEQLLVLRWCMGRMCVRVFSSCEA